MSQNIQEKRQKLKATFVQLHRQRFNGDGFLKFRIIPGATVREIEPTFLLKHHFVVFWQRFDFVGARRKCYKTGPSIKPWVTKVPEIRLSKNLELLWVYKCHN